MAEGLLKSALQSEGNIVVASAGVAAMPGQPMSAETEEILSQKGAAVPSFRSQQVSEKLLSQADQIIAMTASHAEMVRRFFGGSAGEVALLTDFIDPDEGLVGADIPDPIGMGRPAYEEVAEVMELAMPGIIDSLKTN